MFETNSISQKFSLKYADNVPKGYDISEIQFTFDFIYLVLKREASIAAAVESVSNEYGLSKDYMMDYFIENKYILDKRDFNDFSKQIKDYNTKSLKKLLKKHGLKKSGKRNTLEKRIFENNLLGGGGYRISSKSKIFYKNKKRRIRIFEEFLSDNYYFTEFNDFYMDNYRKKKDKIPVEFIKRHIEKAIDDKNHSNFIFNNHIMAEHYFNTEKYKKMLEHVLKIYCMNLNPIWKIDELKDHGGFSYETYNQLISLNGRFGRNIVISTYYYIWNSFEFENIIVSKYEGYRYLKDILNLKSYQKIIKDLQDRFYDNEDLHIKKITQKTLFDF